MVTDKHRRVPTEAQSWPECDKRNGYFKIDGTFRCRSCNFNGQVKETKKSKGK